MCVAAHSRPQRPQPGPWPMASRLQKPQLHSHPQIAYSLAAMRLEWQGPRALKRRRRPPEPHAEQSAREKDLR